ncbi:MAG: hypothetical protein CV087_10565 [Candidatus Brocadia sp. WS118]|nr:MAG: hypothetical protein CV087_10565 [Candidatus Brocadia sp. WS118]
MHFHISGDIFAGQIVMVTIRLLFRQDNKINTIEKPPVDPCSPSSGGRAKIFSLQGTRPDLCSSAPAGQEKGKIRENPWMIYRM